MKRIISILLHAVVFAAVLCTVHVYAMTQQEIDKYNNLYYPQSTYNGGINSAASTGSGEAYVDPATGSTHINVTDVTLPGAGGFDLSISRTYNSQNAALFEAYLKETDTDETATYYMLRGNKKVYTVYTDNSTDTTIYDDVCLTPKFDTYLNNKSAEWMVCNSSKYEYDYVETPPNTKLFVTAADAQAVADYINSGSYEIESVFPYDNMPRCNVDYYNFTVLAVQISVTYTEYENALLDDTSCERYSKLGTGWEFDFPYVETRYGYEDTYEYLHFGTKGTYLIDFGSDGGENGLAGYALNDIRLTSDTSVTHDGMQSKYLAVQKDGTKYYFGTDGRLLYTEDRHGNRIKFYCETENYMNVWGKYKSYPYISRIVDSVGRTISFTTENQNNDDKILYMTISNPDDEEDNRVYEYYLDKLSNSEIKITNFREIKGLQCDEWVLRVVTNPEGDVYRYNYTFMPVKFSFLNRNELFYSDYGDVRKESFGNSFVTDDNIEEFKGMHNTYALVKSAVYNGKNSHYFTYSRFAKNCTLNGSMIFPKAYEYHGDSVKDYAGNRYTLNSKKYFYDINNVGEYDGYIGYTETERIGSSYNYAVKVSDCNMPGDKYSYSIYQYEYNGLGCNKTILTKSIVSRGSDHKTVVDYSYSADTNLPVSIVNKIYSSPDSTGYMTTSTDYTYDSQKYGGCIV